MDWGNECCPELADIPNTVQSVRAYQPLNVSHYKASWVNGQGWHEPSWPGRMTDLRYWDRGRLEEFLPAVDRAGPAWYGGSLTTLCGVCLNAPSAAFSFPSLLPGDTDGVLTSSRGDGSMGRA